MSERISSRRLHWSAWVELALILIFAGAVLESAQHAVTYRFNAPTDEEYYLRYAIRIAEDGPSAFPDLFRERLQDIPTTRFFPSPARLTTIVLDAVAVHFAGPTFGSLQRVSLVAFLALLVLVYVGLHQVLGGNTAVWTTLLLAVSPLHLAMARRALADSLVATLFIICLWCCIRGLTEQRTRPSWWWGISVGYMMAFLAKESTLILIPISLALLGVCSLHGRIRPTLHAFAAVSIVPLTGAALLLALAAGGMLPAWQVLYHTISSPMANAYAVHFQSGPWFRYLVDYVLLSPWTTLLYLIWLGYLVGTRPDDEFLLLWALVPILFVTFSAPFTKNVRLALGLETPMRLGAVLMVQALLRDRGGHRGAAVLLGAVVLGLAWFDLQTFYCFFPLGGVYDPVSIQLLDQRHFLP